MLQEAKKRGRGGLVYKKTFVALLFALVMAAGVSANALDRIGIISSNLQSSSVVAGEEVVIQGILTRVEQGIGENTYTIEVEGYENWATLIELEPSQLNILEGASEDFLITFDIDEDVSGEQSFNIKATSHNSSGVESRQIFINVQASQPITPTYDVAYILEDATPLSGNVLTALNDLGMSYKVVRDSEIPSADFSQYSILLVTEKVGNRDQIPFNSKNTIFFDGTIAEQVWGGMTDGSTSSAARVRVMDKYHPIMNGFPEDVSEITIHQQSSTKTIHYLKNKLAVVKNVAVGLQSNTNDKTIVGYSQRQISGNMVQSVFFGIVESNSWNDNSKNMFKNSLTWLMTGVDQDGDGYVFAEDCNDQNDEIYPGADEIAYDGIDQNCDGLDLLDDDGDGFCLAGSTIVDASEQCSLETGPRGTDCDDSDYLVNTDSEDLAMNCVNDAPVLTFVPTDLLFRENELVEFSVEAYDPEDDALEFSIDDVRFEVDWNTFTWQATYEDVGSYDFVVSVSDGEYSDSKTVNIEISDVNRVPEAVWSGEYEFNEDTELEIDLNEIFSDPDGDALAFEIVSNDNSDIFVFVEGETAVFSATEDYNGEGLVVFSASDGSDSVESEPITLRVLPVNDAPVLLADIVDLTTAEDVSLEGALDLNEHFYDVDSELVFYVTGNDSVFVTVEDGVVSFFPSKDFSGEDEMRFVASDGEYAIESNIFTLFVTDEGEPPVFLPLECETEIDEDSTHTCVLNASDFEGDELTYSVTDSENVVCEVEGGLLTYTPDDDYFGEAWCDLRVSAVDGSDTARLELNVLPVNDMPNMDDFSPSSDVVRIIEGRNKTFSVDANDIDSELLFRWMLDGLLVGEDSSEYEFSMPLGEYLLEVNVTDEGYALSRIWNVIVAPASEFTCSEVGGSICSGDDVCAGETVGTTDSAACCMTSCIPTFDEACEVISDKLKIEVIDPTQGDEITIGTNIDLAAKVTNEMGEDSDIDVEFYLYNLDRDRSEEDTSVESEVRSGAARIVRTDMDIPTDIEIDHDYALFVKAIEGDQCAQSYSLLTLEWPQNLIEIDNVEMPRTVSCGDQVNSRVRVDNLGTREQSVIVSLENSRLDMDLDSSLFTLEEAGEDDSQTSEFSFTVPEDAESGSYDIKIVARYGSKTVTETRTVDVICVEETVAGSETLAQPIEGESALILNTAREMLNGKSENVKDRASILAFMSLNFLLVIAALGLYFVYARNSSVRRKSKIEKLGLPKMPSEPRVPKPPRYR